MQNFKNILEDILKPRSEQQAWKLNLIKNWPLIIGSLHEKISLQKIYKNSVVLGVYDQSWMQELYLLSKLILKKINNHLDQPRIETLRFQCKEKKSGQNKQKSPIKKTQQTFTLKPAELKALQKIQDQQLSEALQSFLRKCQQ